MTEQREKKETHPTYGVIGWNRVETGYPGQNLFDSPLRHQHFVSISIRRAERHRHLAQDWIHGRDELIAVYLAPDQFAEFLTSPNQGFGVPCTLRHVNRTSQGRCPDRVESDEFREELEEDFKDIKQQTETLVERINSVLEKSKVSKAHKQAIKNAAEQLQIKMFSNLPFLRDQMQRAMGKVVTKAKFAVEAFTEERLRSKGLKVEDAPKLIHFQDEQKER